MSDRLFRDRRDAGRVLAGLLEHYRDRADVIVLGLPRGGVPVAYEVATALGAPLDVFLVRKLGVPGHTGASMRAAIQALRQLWPARIVVAVPAAPESTCRELAALVDEVVCATTPSPFFAVGQSYWDFTQTTDEEVRDLLRAASVSRPAAAGPRGRRTWPSSAPRLRWSRMAYRPTRCCSTWSGGTRLVLLGEASHGTHEGLVRPSPDVRAAPRVTAQVHGDRVLPSPRAWGRTWPPSCRRARRSDAGRRERHTLRRRCVGEFRLGGTRPRSLLSPERLVRYDEVRRCCSVGGRGPGRLLA